MQQNPENWGEAGDSDSTPNEETLANQTADQVARALRNPDGGLCSSDEIISKVSALKAMFNRNR